MKADAVIRRQVVGTLGLGVGMDVHLADLELADLPIRHAVFKRGIRLFDRSAGRLRALEHSTAIHYIDGEYHRRLIAARHRALLERQLG